MNETGRNETLWERDRLAYTEALSDYRAEIQCTLMSKYLVDLGYAYALMEGKDEDIIACMENGVEAELAAEDLFLNH
jgi:hypothetical protein